MKSNTTVEMQRRLTKRGGLFNKPVSIYALPLIVQQAQGFGPLQKSIGTGKEEYRPLSRW
jgi:hypothetical protein